MLKNLLPFTPQAQNSMTTLDVLGNVGGKVINRLILNIGGAANVKSNMTIIQLFASDSDKGGKIILNTTGANADARQQYRGVTANAAFLTLDFNEIRAKTIKGQKLGALDTRLLKTLQLQITFGAASAAPTVTGQAEYDEGADYDKLYDPVERALMAKVLSQTFNPGGAGTFGIKLPFGQVGGSLIKRIHYFGATVTGAEVRKNGFVVHQSVAAQNQFLQNEYGRTPQANVYTVDFIMDGNQSYALNAADAQSMEYYVTTSGAGNITAELELLDPLGNN